MSDVIVGMTKDGSVIGYCVPEERKLEVFNWLGSLGIIEHRWTESIDKWDQRKKEQKG